jgi:hypothetical protein
MDPHDEGIEALLAATQVGDTVRMLLPKVQVVAVTRDRVSPILERPSNPDGPAVLRGFIKDPAGMWDLEGITGAKDATVVEVLLRRAASTV